MARTPAARARPVGIRSAQRSRASIRCSISTRARRRSRTSPTSGSRSSVTTRRILASRRSWSSTGPAYGTTSPGRSIRRPRASSQAAPIHGVGRRSRGRSRTGPRIRPGLLTRRRATCPVVTATPFARDPAHTRTLASRQSRPIRPSITKMGSSRWRQIPPRPRLNTSIS